MVWVGRDGRPGEEGEGEGWKAQGERGGRGREEGGGGGVRLGIGCILGLNGGRREKKGTKEGGVW